MDREELKEKILSVKDVNKDINIVYEVLDSIGVKFKHSNCRKCRLDAYNIALEELGLMADASEASAFDARYEYLMDRDYSWQGHRLNQETPEWVIRRFMACHKDAGLYYRVVQAADNKENTEEN